jgi:hypothetical protein
VEDGAPRELALGHPHFDQSLPKSINKAKWIELAICEKREDCVEEKVSENRQFAFSYCFVSLNFIHLLLEQVSE